MRAISGEVWTSRKKNNNKARGEQMTMFGVKKKLFPWNVRKKGNFCPAEFCVGGGNTELIFEFMTKWKPLQFYMYS